MWHRLCHMYVGRAFTCCLNCDFRGFRGLTAVRGWLALGVSFHCLRELYEPLHGGSCFGGNMAEIAEMAEKSGKSGRIFFSGPCCRHAFASVFPCPESVPGSGKFATMLIHYSNRRQTHAGSLAVGGMVSCLDGLGRVMSGQVGQFSSFCTLAFGVAKAFPPCLCWVLGGLHSCQGRPSLFDSLAAGFIA